MLFFEGSKELTNYISNNKPDWEVKDGRIFFKVTEAQKLEIPVYFNKKLEKIINKKAVFSDGEALSAELIIGADGLHSNVRKTIADEAKPLFTRQIDDHS